MDALIGVLFQIDLIAFERKKELSLYGKEISHKRFINIVERNERTRLKFCGFSENVLLGCLSLRFTVPTGTKFVQNFIFIYCMS